MTKKKVLLGFCDGFTQGIILYLFLAFTVAHFAGGGSIEGVFVITVLLALLSPLSYYVFVLRNGMGKRLLALSVISFLVFVLTVALSVVISWGPMLFPVNGPINNSAGILLLLEVPTFFCISVVLRLLVLMIRKIKTKK